MTDKLENEKINPSDIIFEEGTDADMPEPETASYKEESKDDDKFLRLTSKCLKLIEQCLGKLPYNAVLKNGDNSIKLTELLKYIDAKSNKISVSEMNTIIGFIASAPFEYVKPLMEIIEDTPRQKELWAII